MKTLVSLVAAATILCSCGKTKPAPVPAPTPTISPDDVPLLNRALIFQWIAAEAEFRELGFHAVSNPLVGPGSAESATIVKETDDFAHRYGFTDYTQYDRVRRRIVLARLYVVKNRLRTQREDNLKQQVRIAKDVVTDDGTSEENKKLWRGKMMAALEELQALPPPDPPQVPAADVLVVQQFDSEIARAEGQAGGK